MIFLCHFPNSNEIKILLCHSLYSDKIWILLCHSTFNDVIMILLCHSPYSNKIRILCLIKNVETVIREFKSRVVLFGGSATNWNSILFTAHPKSVIVFYGKILHRNKPISFLNCLPVNILVIYGTLFGRARP